MKTAYCEECKRNTQWSEEGCFSTSYCTECLFNEPMKTAEDILFEIDQLRIKYKGQKIDIEEGSKYINEALEILTTWKEDICKKQREECHQVFVNYGDPNDLNDLKIARKIKNAPEPN